MTTRIGRLPQSTLPKFHTESFAFLVVNTSSVLIIQSFYVSNCYLSECFMIFSSQLEREFDVFMRLLKQFKTEIMA